jgi:hypothetical protein
MFFIIFPVSSGKEDIRSKIQIFGMKTANILMGICPLIL